MSGNPDFSALAQPSAKATTSLPGVQSVEPRQRYTHRRAIGNSLFGRVLLAHDVLSNKPVAIKLSNRTLLESHVTASRVRVLEDVRTEAAILRALPAHPNVVKLVDEHYEPELHWMVLEYLDGGELFDVVATHGALAESSVANALGQVGSGLYHLHQHGYAHLDVSLENVLLSQQDGVLKLCDFGVARQVAPSSPYLAPYPQERPGKLNYMAPEVLAGRDYFDAFKADVFSLGVTVFCMLVGSPPFEHATLKDPRFAMIAQGRFREMMQSLRITNLSESALTLLEGMLHPDPAKRMTLLDVLSHPFLVDNLRKQAAQQAAPTSSSAVHDPAQDVEMSIAPSPSPSPVPTKDEQRPATSA